MITINVHGYDKDVDVDVNSGLPDIFKEVDKIVAEMDLPSKETNRLARMVQVELMKKYLS